MELIQPDWPAPPTVHGGTTLRSGGYSAGRFSSLNLGDHVDDNTAAVAANRRLLSDTLVLPSPPIWLNQVHGTSVVNAFGATPNSVADGSYADRPGVVCAVLTADCLPVIFCDRAGTRVAVAHAGWRGLAAGVLEATVEAMGVVPSQLMAWLGPAIGPQAFEVGGEVREAFVNFANEASEAFTPSLNGRWFADIYVLAAQRLVRRGVADVYGGGWCTFNERDRFYSYRRDKITGRMATLAWID